jgi:hypothetical protein
VFFVAAAAAPEDTSGLRIDLSGEGGTPQLSAADRAQLEADIADDAWPVLGIVMARSAW